VKEVELLGVDGNVKMKKRKLNSKNPKYYPVEEDLVKERKSAYASGWGVRCTKAGGPSKFGGGKKKK